MGLVVYGQYKIYDVWQINNLGTHLIVEGQMALIMSFILKLICPSKYNNIAVFDFTVHN